MKRSVAVTLMFLLFIGNAAFAQLQSVSPVVQQDEAKLTNADVIELVGLGFSNDVIIDKIYASPATDFDTSIRGLKALKAAKVSDAVIRVMINPKPGPSSVDPSGAAQTPQLASDQSPVATKYSPAPQVSADAAPKPVSRLGSVRRIAVDSLGQADAAILVREKLMNRIAQSGQITVVEDLGDADAVLGGVVGVNAYGNANTAALHLNDTTGRFLWSDETSVWGNRDAISGKVGEKLADHLVDAIRNDAKKSDQGQ
jgi:hypothetical protein